MSLTRPLQVPANVTAAARVLAGLDRCFLVGFSRLGPDQIRALHLLCAVCAGTPLAVPLVEAVAALTRGEFIDRHFAALAAARAALQGAQYDALRAHATEVLGRPAPVMDDPWPASRAGGDDSPLTVWQESSRAWLMELALAGFSQLDERTLFPFLATLERLQDEPRAARLAALLTGFLNELLAALPVASLPDLPLFRWVDLWTRGMVGALRTFALPAAKPVNGTLSPLGLDLHAHGFFSTATIYGLLEEPEGTALVRVPLSSYKVDVVACPELWDCFGPAAKPLLKAAAERKAVTIDGMSLLPTGDLLWGSQAKLGKAFSPLKVAAARFAPDVADAVTPGPVAAADRHPLHLAEPVYLAGYDVEKRDDGWWFNFGEGGALPMAVNRAAAGVDLGGFDWADSSELFGLLRFDGGGWSVQPLAARFQDRAVGETLLGIGKGWDKRAKKEDSLGQLQERAGRLLRQRA